MESGMGNLGFAIAVLACLAASAGTACDGGAFVRAVAPSDGATVPLLNDAQKEFLAMPRETRRVKFDEPDFRAALKDRCGQWPLDVMLSWTNDAPGRCELSVCRLPDRAAVRPLSQDRFSAVLRNLEIGRTYEWVVSCGAVAATNRFTTEAVAPRLIRDPHVPNVRDVGGRRGLGGRMVRQGRIFRSAGLNGNVGMAYTTREEVVAADADGSVRRRDADLAAEAERLSAAKTCRTAAVDVSGPWECEREDGRVESVCADANHGVWLKGRPRETAIMRKSFVADDDGYAVFGCGGDWYWRLSVNGVVEADRMEGNDLPEDVSADNFSVAVPVRRGTNAVETVLKAGNAGFVFYCRADARDGAATAAARLDTIRDMRKKLFCHAKGLRAGRTRIHDDNRKTWLEEFGVRSDIDLRSDGECFGMDGSPLGPTVAWFHHPGLDYEKFVEGERGRKAFAQAFKVFLDEKNYPIVFHCIGGQDRTGSVSFVLLALLGVDEEELFRDWEATAFYNKECKAFNHKRRFDAMWAAFERFGASDMRGNVEAYVKACGFGDGDIARFRELMLENP